MKTKIILLHVIFFILLFCIERIFHTQSNVKIILGSILLLGLSFCMCRYMLQSDKMIYISLWICLSLSFFFEMSKYIEHKLGYLPRYGDVPIPIGLALTLVVMVAYVSILFLICLFWKKVKSL